MLKDGIRFAALAFAIAMSVLSGCSARAARPNEKQTPMFAPVEGDQKIVKAVAEAQKLIDDGDTDAAQDIFYSLQEEFPKIVRPDLDLFVKAEVYFIEDKYAKAAKYFEKLLTDHPGTSLRDAALDREFTIATAYLEGRKKTVLGFLRLAGYSEGVRIMEKITDRVGLDSDLGTKAAVAVARNYEDRQLYNEAYLKWWEISLQWSAGPVGKEALLGMAQSKLDAYNKRPESKRHLFDASGLRTAKSCFARFKLLYPVDARQMDVDKIINQIDEEMAYKQLSIGQYYEYTGYQQAANLYYHMVASDWPHTQAAKTAKELLAAERDLTGDDQTPAEK
jgi:outer membrane protein assembly factor BamD (BamD/ComL family)